MRICRNQCHYQAEGICTLSAAAAAGVPPLGGACIRIIPAGAKLLGLPHRYYEPGSNAYQPVQTTNQRDVQESDIS